MSRTWSKWLAQMFNTPMKKKVPIRRSGKSALRPGIETLEDRVVPAITILDSGVGTLDNLVSATDGTILASESTGNQTLSRAALQGIGPSVNISISSDAITFNNLSSTLTLQTAAGSSATFDAGAGALTFNDVTDTFATSGGSLILTAGGNMTIGSLNTNNGNIVLTSGGTFAATGSIVGAATNITGPNGVNVQTIIGTTITIDSSAGAITSTAGTIQASAQLTTNAATGITINTLANQFAATNSTSGNISVTQAASPTQTLTLVGDVVNSAAGGTISIVNNGAAINVGPSVDVTTAGNGAITLSATDLSIDPTSTIDSGSGRTTLSNSTAGRQIDLGTDTVGKFSLTQAELTRVLSSGVLQIGNSTPGLLSGTFMITAPINFNALSGPPSAVQLVSGAAMTDTAAGSLTVTNLRLSGTGPITLDNGGPNTVDNLVADLTGDLFFSNGAAPLLTVGASIDGITGITSLGNNITLEADNIDIANAINVGNGASGGTVTLRPSTANLDIDLGSAVDSNTPLELSDAELDRITARILRIGSTTGNITITEVISGTSYDNLSLINSGAGVISQEAGDTITVGGLAIQSAQTVVFNEANDVTTLSALISGAGNDFRFTDVSSFSVGTVDGVVGITTSTAADSEVTLTAGGAVTQTARIITNELELLGTGPYTLTNTANDAVFLSANLTTATTGTLTYTDANALTIGTAGGTDGVTTNDSNITVDTVNGALTVADANAGADVNAGAASVSLTAGSSGNDNAITINAGASVVGTGTPLGVQLRADNIDIQAGATIDASGTLALLLPFEAATAINLGGADGSATLGLTDAELDRITAGRIQIGGFLSVGPPATFANTGDITITALIDPDNTTALSLFTGGRILDSNGGTDIIETNLTLVAGMGVGNTGAIDTAVSNLEGAVNTGGFNVENTGALTIGGDNTTFNGILAGGGDITVTSDTTITVDEVVSNTGGGNILLDAPGNIDVNAAVSATGGSGNISILSDTHLTVDASVSTVGSGTITLRGDENAGGTGDFTSTGPGTVSSAGGAITISGVNVTIGGTVTSNAGGSITLDATTAGGGTLDINAAVTASGGNGNVSLLADDNITVDAPVSAAGNGTITANADVDASGAGDFTNTAAVTTAGGNITIRAQDIDLGAGVSTTLTGPGNQVFLLGREVGDVITLGTDTAGALGLTDADLDNITTGILNIGSTATNTAGIQITGQITQAGSGYTTLSLETAGAITDNTGGEQTDITVDNLALRAGMGIGTAGAGNLDLAVSNLAFNNVNAGIVNIFNTGALTIASVDGLTSSANTSTGATTTITTSSPLTFAVNTSSDGDAIYTAGEIDDDPACADDLTVNSGVTVSTIGVGSDLTLRAGDDVIINGTVNAADVLTIFAGFNDLDGCGTFTINGTISGNVINLISEESICLPTLNLPSSAINITSVSGAIYDCDPAGSDDIDITAASVTFSAATGIGITDAIGTGGAIETQVGALEAQTSTGGIFINNGFTSPTTLNIGGLNALEGVRVTGASGDIVLNNNGTIIATVTDDVFRGPNNITVNANGVNADLILGGQDEAPSAIFSTNVGDVVATAGRDVIAGDAVDGGDIGANNGSLTVTAGRHIVLDNDTLFFVNNGADTLAVTAGGNISLVQAFGVGSEIRHSGSGVVNITTGALATFTLDAGAGGTVSSTSGAINITADDVVIVAPSTIVSSSGGVITIKQVTGTRQIDLGTNAGGELGLTDAELDQISTSARLVIGDTANTGTITITAAIDAANITNLHLLTGGLIDDSAGALITETNLYLGASTGIGSSGNPINTSVSNLEANTATGGIFIANTSTVLNIGGVPGAATAGVIVTTSGDINITNDNSIVLTDTDGNETILGGSTSGNISLTATGATSDITSTVDQDAITAPAGSIMLNAGRDINFGNGSDFDNDVIANDGISFTAGRDITIQGFADVTSDAFGNNTGGSVVFTADRDINVSSANGDDASVTAGGNAGGDVTFTAGPNAFVRITSTDFGSGTVVSNSGDVTINTDRILITTNAGVRATTGIVTIQQVSPAWAIDLGSTTDAAALTLELSDAEFDRIFAGRVRIGDPANIGNVTITSQISPAGTNILAIRTAGSIADGTAGEQADLIVADLQLRAGTGIGVGGEDIDVDVANTSLAALNTTSGNILISDVNDLTVGSVDGVDGVTNQAVGGSVVLEAGFGGSGNLVVTNTPAAADVAGTGNAVVILRANDAVTLNAGAVVQSGNGPVTVQSNFNDPNGTANITLQAGAFIKTEGDIIVDANPDANTLGGGIIYTSTTQFTGGGAGAATQANAAQNVTLRAGAFDLVIDDLFADNDVSITTRTNILDDSVDTTRIRAGNNILLSAGGLIGGILATPTPITPADILSADFGSPTANFLAALDVAYGNQLSLTQTNTLGNIQIRKIESGLNTSSVILNGTLVNSGNQLALISSGGNLTVDNAFMVNNGDLLLATTGGGSIAINTASGVTNTDPNATTNLMASGNGTASITGSAANVIAEVSGNSIGLYTSGGNIGTVANALKVNANAITGRFDGFTTGGGATGGDVFVTDTQNGIRVGQFNAGTGNVTLTSQGNISPTGSSIVAVTANDNIAEIIGNVVTLNATATSTGTGGQIGQSGGVFFEVNSNVLNATTNNSNLWISEVGTGGTAGTQIGTVNIGNLAGTTAFLRVRNGGTITSQTVDGTADVTAPTVNLSTVAGDSGNFGTSTANPLEIAADTLNSNLAGGGNLFVRDQTGGLTVQRATTTSGNIGIEVAAAGNNLVLGNGSSSGTVVSATGTTTLTATGAITSNAPGGVIDVTSGSLAATAGTGVGTSGTPLETAVSTLAASGGTGGVFINNTGALTIGTVSGVVGVSATDGDIVVTTASPMIVDADVTSPDDVTLTSTDNAGTGDDLTVNAGVTVSSTGGGNVTLQAGDNLTVNGTVSTSGAGVISLTGDFGNADTGLGTTITVSSTAALNADTTVQISGGTDSDTFNIRPQTTTPGAPLNIIGNNPTTLPGDTLNIDLADATGTVFNPTGLGAGNFTFTNRDSVTFTGIETLNALNGTFALTLDMAAAGFQNGSANPDIVNISTTAGGVLNITVQDNGGAAQSFFSGAASGVSSFTLIGSSDRETVNIDLTNALVPDSNIQGNAPTVAPGDTLNINTTNATGTTFTSTGPGSGTFTFTNRNTITFSGMENFAPQILSIVANDPDAAETNPGQPTDPGQFTVTRTGDTSAPLTVNYTVTGTATNGVDYQTLSGSVTFAAGATTATIDVNVIRNAIVEPAETVTVTLIAGPGTVVSAQNSATVTIADAANPTFRRIATGASINAHVKVFDNGSTNPTFSFLAFPGFPGGVVTAVGDVNGDNVADIGVAVAGDGPAHVKVFDGVTGAEVLSFIAFDGYFGGLTLAMGDVDGNGRADLIVGAATGVSHVKVFNGQTAQLLSSFFAFPGVPVGVSVAAGDTNGDGIAEIIVGARAIAPHIKTFDILGNQMSSYYAFDPNTVPVGVSVGAGDLNGDGIAEILASVNVNGGRFVSVSNADPVPTIRNALALPPGTPSLIGPSISASDIDGDGDDELVVALGANLSLFNGIGLVQFGSFEAYLGFTGGVFVG